VGAELTGVLSDGRTVDLVISGAAAEGDLTYYELAMEGLPLCTASDRGLFVPGVWDGSGQRHDAVSVGGNELRTSYSCITGAIGKCVVWGYEPSTVGADLHQSCTRMVRADYCGSGISFTKDGTLIDIFDTRGVQEPTMGDASLVFEAGWTTTGAACVHRPRYEAWSTSGAEILPSCWADLPRCASFSEAQSHGAVLGNASRVQSRTFCQ
jgi:hypothetical protein